MVNNILTQQEFSRECVATENDKTDGTQRSRIERAREMSKDINDVATQHRGTGNKMGSRFLGLCRHPGWA